MPIPDAIRPSGAQHMDDPGVEGATVIDNVQDRIDWLETAKAETSTVLTTEQVQDLVAAMIVAGSNVTATYDDGAGTVTISSTGGGGGGSMTREEIEDLLASSFVAGAGITVTYSDVGNSFTIANTDGGAAAVATHTGDTSAAHLATAIDHSVTGAFVVAGTVQGAISDLDTAIGTVNAGLSGKAATSHTHTITGEIIFGVTGAATVRTGTAKVPNKSGRTRTITGVTITATTAPTGATMIADVNINGTTIFGTQANRPTITASSTALFTTTGMSVTSWTDGQWLTVDIDQIGSTVAGSDVTVTVHYTEVA
jgi:hypothetical protein